MKCTECDNGEVYRPSSVPGAEPWETCMCCNGTGEMPTPEEIRELRIRIIDLECDLHLTQSELNSFKEHYE